MPSNKRRRNAGGSHLTAERGVAVVTGAAQGLGRAIVEALAEHGWNVAAMDVQPEGLHALRAEAGDRVTTWTVDLTDAGQTRSAIEEVQRTLGHVDYLVHNAAILIEEPFTDVGFERWQATLNVGLQAAYLLTTSVWQGMLERKRGRVIYVSSRSGIEGFANETAYCAAKHGLEGFMKSLALECEGTGVAVSTITPGMYMRTPMSERNYPPEAKAKWVEPAVLATAFVRLGETLNEQYNGERLNAWDLRQETDASHD